MDSWDTLAMVQRLGPKYIPQGACKQLTRKVNCGWYGVLGGMRYSSSFKMEMELDKSLSLYLV